MDWMLPADRGWVWPVTVSPGIARVALCAHRTQLRSNVACRRVNRRTRDAVEVRRSLVESFSCPRTGRQQDSPLA